ncbi:MAG: ubiquinone/menaquinone biosynthesis methyltransferase [Desulfomonilaceae bacterium]|nr:ubiquinone/menaquinone biosynthesis methyltransferase [Desulfomonilaceae bacterium]
MPDPVEPPKVRDSLISAEENRSMFDRIARYYDGTNRLLTFGLDARWRRKAVSRLALMLGSTYLDVGCGTGDMALEIVRQAPGSTVVGIDPSQGMLEVGRTKVREVGLDHAISLQKGDVLDLGFEDDTFDGAITAFCIRNVTNRLRALKEIRRVVRPGGLLVILELTEPMGPVMGPLFRIYGKVVMPAVTAVMSSKSAYRYLTDSMADFPEPGDILAVLKEAGYINRKYGHMTGGIVTLFEGQVPARSDESPAAP